MVPTSFVAVAGTGMTIDVVQCSKHYHQSPGHSTVQVLDRCSFSVAKHEFVVLLGPSGCGKTTLLRMIAGLTSWDQGEILIDSIPVCGPGKDRAMVFQNFALLPWADVQRNIAFGLELRGMNVMERERIAMDFVETMGLKGFEHHFPKQLSGGMQQRVGLARALAIEPNILLMDEPFGALDAITRRIMQDELMRLHADKAKTVVFVTHDLDEAIRLADRIIVLSARPGRVVETVTVPPTNRRNNDFIESMEVRDIRARLWKTLQRLHDEPATGALPEKSYA